MKKLLATILTLVMALGLCSVSWAETTTLPQADANGVITLDDDVTLASTWYISDGKTYTLNLNGHTISGGSPVIQLMHGKLIINGAGTVKESTPYFGAVLIKGSENASDENYSVLEVNSNVTLEGWAPIFVDQFNSKQNKPFAYGVSVSLNGATLNAKKDSGGDGGEGLYVNGTIKHETNAPVIRLTSTKINAEEKCFGMYLAGYAKTTLTDCDISGVTGIEIRAGELTVNGGSVTATGNYSVMFNGNGSTTQGAAIAVAQHTTKKDIIVKLNGGTYTGEKAISESNPQENDPAPQVDMEVLAGTYSGEIVAADISNFISGGTFSVPVGAGQLVDGLNYEVHTNAGYVYYSDVTTAVAAAQANNAEVNTPGTEGDPFVIVWDYGYDGISVKVNSATGQIDPPELKRSGYTFKGWKMNGSTEVYSSQQIKNWNGPLGDTNRLTAVWSANSYYYYPSTTTDSKTDSPKTFDAGVGIYAVTAVLSVTGMAWVGKKRH